jgi:hypothetical protein
MKDAEHLAARPASLRIMLACTDCDCKFGDFVHEMTWRGVQLDMWMCVYAPLRPGNGSDSLTGGLLRRFPYLQV